MWARTIDHVRMWRNKSSGQTFEDSRELNGEHIELLNDHLRTDVHNYGRCACPKFNDGVVYASDEISMPYSYEYGMDFRTGEDFGCVHFQP